MAQLPSDSLLEFAKTQDLIKEWLKSKGKAIWLGKCLKARFGGGGGNPAKRALNDGRIDNFDYIAMLAVVELYATFFTLIQIAWEEIQESISCIENFPKTETALFFEVLRQFYDSRFMRLANGCKRSARNIESLARVGRDAVWQHHIELKDPSWNGTLNPEESASATSLISKNLKERDFCWYSLVTDICKEAAKEDCEIKRQLRRHFDAIGRVCDVILRGHRRERGPKPRGRFRSEKWENGRCRLGKKGGFELPSADSPIPSVTELNETISHIIRRSSQY